MSDTMSSVSKSIKHTTTSKVLKDVRKEQERLHFDCERNDYYLKQIQNVNMLIKAIQSFGYQSN